MDQDQRIMRTTLLCGCIIVVIFVLFLLALHDVNVSASFRSDIDGWRSQGLADPAGSVSIGAPAAHETVRQTENLSQSAHKNTNVETVKSQNDQQKKEDKRFMGSSIGADDAVAIFTLLLCLVTFALYRATRDLVKEGKATSRNQLRAYLTTAQARYNFSVSEQIINIRYVNSGQTPAYKVKYQICVKFIRNSDEAKFPLPLDARHSGILGPGQHKIIKHRINRSIGEDEFKLMGIDEA